MSTNFNCCNSVSRYVPNTGAEDVIDRITNKTTPEEFEGIRAEFPRFQLWQPKDNQGFTVLHQAAQQGNIQLIKYLVKQAPELLERGAYLYQYTPLCMSFHGGFNAMETLLELGANPNTMFRSMDGTHHVSFLKFLANLQLTQLSMNSPTNNTEQSIKLFLKYGAELQPEDNQANNLDLSSIKSLIQRASQEVAEERRQTYKTILDSNLLPPSDLCKLVCQYV
jgi:Ankyrin repeats (3 copies)